MYIYNKQIHIFYKNNHRSITNIHYLNYFQSSRIANKRIQPYEVHLPFILQFCVDYNLFGMNNIEVKNVQFRHLENNTSK